MIRTYNAVVTEALALGFELLDKKCQHTEYVVLNTYSGDVYSVLDAYEDSELILFSVDRDDYAIYYELSADYQNYDEKPFEELTEEEYEDFKRRARHDHIVCFTRAIDLALEEAVFYDNIKIDYGFITF